VHLPPQGGSSSTKPGSITGKADVLAWESTADDVDVTSPWPSVEGADIVPDWESWQASISLSGKKDSSRIGIKLNSALGAPSKQMPSQDASSCPCK
jgi:hypothetical protein